MARRSIDWLQLDYLPRPIEMGVVQQDPH